VSLFVTSFLSFLTKGAWRIQRTQSHKEFLGRPTIFTVIGLILPKIYSRRSFVIRTGFNAFDDEK
jgi:hypothetical protein